MEKIPSTMVLHKHVDGTDTRFSTMEGPFANNPLVKWIVVIKIGTYQAASEDIRWAYEPVSDLLTDIDTDSESSNEGSGDEGSKDQDNPDDQEQEGVLLVPRSNPRRLRQGNQRALLQLKS